MIVERERIRQMKLIEELGKRRMLTVVKTVDFGIYLGTSAGGSIIGIYSTK